MAVIVLLLLDDLAVMSGCDVGQAVIVGWPYVPQFRFARGRRVIFASRARSTPNVSASIHLGAGEGGCAALLAPSPSALLTLPSCRQSARPTQRSTARCVTTRWTRLPQTTATPMPTHRARPRAMQSRRPAAILSRGRRVNARKGPIAPVSTVDSGSRAVICKSWTIHQYRHYYTVYSRLGEPYRPR